MQERPLLTTAGFALVWVLAAAMANDTTFHLAPVIVAGVPAMLWRGRRLTGLALGVGGAVAIAMALAISGQLGGPSLLPFGGALVESVAGALLGGLAGSVANRTPVEEVVHDQSEAAPIG